MNKTRKVKYISLAVFAALDSPDQVLKSLPISVGYEQTGKVIVPRVANATATITLKYD